MTAEAEVSPTEFSDHYTRPVADGYRRRMVSGETLMAHQAYYPGDSPGWQQQARLLQSLWRERSGLPSRGAGEHDGSYLPDSEVHEKSGAAYISDDARAAVHRAIHDKQPGAVLQEKRLWCNLLSSQPLCFNLFGALSEHTDAASTTAALKAAWADVDQITGISYEHSPGRGSETYLGTRTAFDVYIEYLDDTGRERFIGIEVKYHEDLSGTPPQLRDRALDVLRSSGAFAPTAESAVTTGRTAQLLLDHLLALSINSRGDRRGRCVILYPTANTAVANHVAAYRSHLVEGDDTFQPLTLEDLIAAFRTQLDDRWLDEFHGRYLDLAAVERLVPERWPAPRETR